MPSKSLLFISLHFLFCQIAFAKIFFHKQGQLYFLPEQPIKVNSQENRFRMGIVTMELPLSVKKAITMKLISSGKTAKEAAKIVSQLTQYSQNYERFVSDMNIEVYPVLLNEGLKTIQRKMRNLNGLLLVGGTPGIRNFALDRNSLEFLLNEKSTRRYFKVIDKIIDYAKKLNDQGHNFSLFGICMGFEAILLNEAHFALPLSKINKQNVNDKIYLTFSGKSFLDFVREKSPSELLKQIDSGNVYFNNEKGVSVYNFLTNSSLNSQFEIVAYYKANNGKGESDFVAAFEGKKYPFFGIQFHPEKNLYETSEHFKTDHSEAAKNTARIFQNYLAFSLKRLGKNSSEVLDDFVWEKSDQSVFLSKIGLFENLKVFGPEEDLVMISDALIKRKF